MNNIIAIVLLIIFTGLLAAAAAGYVLQLQVAEQCPPQGAFISVEQSKIHYIDRQGGEFPAVFLHGASSNSKDWQYNLYVHLPESCPLYAKLTATVSLIYGDQDQVI